MPITMSSWFGAVLRSRKSSPPWMAYRIVATLTIASPRSIQLKRLRRRFVTGKSRNTRKSTKPTCA